MSFVDDLYRTVFCKIPYLQFLKYPQRILAKLAIQLKTNLHPCYMEEENMIPKAQIVLCYPFKN